MPTGHGQAYQIVMNIHEMTTYNKMVKNRNLNELWLIEWTPQRGKLDGCIKIKYVAYSSQGSHFSQLDFSKRLADDNTTG